MNETAKKILGFIKRLPETWDGQPLRQQALDNFDEKHAGEIESAYYGYFITHSFVWVNTPEKWEYWNKIHTLIMDGTIQLLPDVEESKEEKKEEFVWTDELALEFSVSPYSTISPLRNGLEQFKASKQRKPLFVTEDGKQIFEADKYWTVDLENGYAVRPIVAIGEMDLPIEEYKDFSTEAAAREYVRLNKPMYSLNDVSIALKIRGFDGFVAHRLIAQLEKLKP